MGQNWESIAHEKKARVNNSIFSEWRLDHIPLVLDVPDVEGFLKTILKGPDDRIAHMSLKEVSDKIAEGELSSYDVVRVFCKRAAIIHQLTNCCSEIFFERALKRAKELDAYYAKHKKTIGPLHGVPISFKDQINIEGIDSAIGFVSKVNKPISKEDVSLLANILEDLGAVFYVKTTTPMAMMSGETSSNIYGPTINSRNRKLTCAGSSGGEGALLGSHGSMLGFGTDLGGSIRLPSNSHGIFGLRVCSNRLPYLHITNSMANQPVMCSVVGPMSPSIDDIEFIVKLVLSPKPWLHDPRCLPIPWREYIPHQKLSFGVIDFSSITYLHPPVRRAFRMIKDSLRREGHEIVTINPPVSLQDMGKLAGKVYCADGCREIAEECKKSGEPIIKEIVMVDSNGNLPEPVKSINEHWDQYGEKYEYQQIFDRYILSTSSLTSTGRPIDGMIVPLQAMCSFKPGDLKKFKVNFTQAFNVLDYAVAATPITIANKNIDVKDEDYIPLNENDKILYEYYDPNLYDGTPVGVQVVAPRYEEERVIRLSKIVNEATRRW